MNYLITYHCPKNCSFCFFPALCKKETQEMTLETFVDNFTHARKLGLSNRVALLGGEPTVALHFKEIVSYLLENNHYVKNICVFSNLMGTENVDWLCAALKGYVDYYIHIIFNCSEFSTLNENQQKIVRKNAQKIVDVVDMSVSLTVSDTTTIESLQYLEDFFAIGIKKVRFAFNSQWVIPKEKSEYLVSLVSYVASIGFRICADTCGFFPTSVFSKDQLDRIASFVGKDVPTSCDACVYDLLPDGTIIPCMPWLSAERRFRFLDATNLADIPLYYGVTPSVQKCSAISRRSMFERRASCEK